MNNENDDRMPGIGSSISHKSKEASLAWEKIKDDATYVCGVFQRYRITKDAFNRKDYSSVPKDEREKVEKTIERMNKVIGEHDEMGLLGNYEIARIFEELCWGKK